MEIELPGSDITVKVNEDTDTAIITDNSVGEMVFINKDDLPEFIEFLSRFL